MIENNEGDENLFMGRSANEVLDAQAVIKKIHEPLEERVNALIAWFNGSLHIPSVDGEKNQESGDNDH